MFKLAAGFVTLRTSLEAGLFALALLLVTNGCASTAPFVWGTTLPVAQDKVERLSRIEQGDKINVVVEEHPELSGEYLVAVDGTFIQPLAGPTQIAGRRLDHAAQFLAAQLAPYLQNPKVSVSLVELRPIRVSILGEVKTSGTYPLTYDDGLLNVLAQSGGLTEFADEDAIYVIRAGSAGQRIRFRYSDLIHGHPNAVRFALKDGDTVLVE